MRFRTDNYCRGHLRASGLRVFRLIGDLSEIRAPFVCSEDACTEAGPNIINFVFF